MKLSELKIGKSGKITSVGGNGELRQHFLDMGLIPGTEVTFVKLAPLGDPMELRLRGYELTLRIGEAAEITVEPTETGETSDIGKRKKAKIDHPGLGESGKYHSKEDSEPLPEGTTLTFALVGNQNCGKTTLFNAITGANQHVGNFPGVTVDSKSAPIKGHPDTLITDLPGVYSMSPYSPEEIVTRNFVLEQKPKAIINIIDATNIERNLYLTMQLLEMNIPMVIALNMMDEMRGNGGSVDINTMEQMLGVPVVPISAAKNEGIGELISHALHVAHYQEKPTRQDYCDENDHSGSVHRCIHAVCHLTEDHAERAGLPVRFAASKLIENDHIVLEMLDLDQNEIEMLEHIISQMENEHGTDRAAVIADMRFDFIEKVCDAAVTKPTESKEHKRSEKIDRILTGKYTGIPVFIAIMIAVFWLTFDVVGAFLQNLLASGISALSDAVGKGLSSAGVNEVIKDLIINGIFEGVGSVLSFMPVIVTLFFFLSILEDSGYIARVAFVMDKLLRKIGLSGRSIVPMLIGFGCTVPAVMSTRTLPSERDRKMTILLTPFMSCSAKLPIYAFFAHTFFPKYSWLVIAGLYLLGMVTGILIALLYKGTLFKGEAVPFVMELPNYRLPGAKNVLRLIWEKAEDFLKKAFTVILAATIVVWFLQSFDIHFNLAHSGETSLLALISGIFVPLFIPLGLGRWEICTALISGVMAKESVVSTLDVLFSSQGGISSVLTSSSALCLLVFSLLYTPCVAAIGAIRREMGVRWAAGVVIFQCLLAWLAAFAVKLICMAFGVA